MSETEIPAVMRAGMPPLGKALDASCPRCGATPQIACEEQKLPCAPHVERGRMARWAAMGVSF